MLVLLFSLAPLAQIRRNMAIADKVAARNLRWKTHDAAQLVTAMQVRKVRRELHDKPWQGGRAVAAQQGADEAVS